MSKTSEERLSVQDLNKRLAVLCNVRPETAGDPEIASTSVSSWFNFNPVGNPVHLYTVLRTIKRQQKMVVFAKAARAGLIGQLPDNADTPGLNLWIGMLAAFEQPEFLCRTAYEVLKK